MKKVVIIGANGQLGYDLVRIGNKYKEELHIIPLTRNDIDITNKNLVNKVLSSIKPNFIINTAAFHQTELCEVESKKAFEVNSVGVKNLVDISKDLDSILIHISTDYVFDGKKIVFKEPYIETDNPNPLNLYGISKYAGELLITHYLDTFYIVRVSSLFGKKGASSKGGNFVIKIIKKAMENQSLQVVNDIFMSPTYTYDAAVEIFNLILEQKPFGIYHISNKGYCSWFEFAKKILEIKGIAAEVIPISHIDLPTQVKRPLWSPLKSIKGIDMPYWEDALYRFLQEIEFIK